MPMNVRFSTFGKKASEKAFSVVLIVSVPSLAFSTTLSPRLSTT